MSETPPGMPGADELSALAGRLAEQAAALRSELASKRSLRKTWGIIAADVLMSLIGLTLWWGQHEQGIRIQDSLQQNYVTAQQQQATRVKVLCPLYTLLLAAVTDPSRPQPGTAAQQAVIAHNVQVIQTGYAALGCRSSQLTPSATTTP